MHAILAFAQTPRQLENIEAFNRVYGYVKYFHPSDEAANLDWDKFAVYGSREIEKCSNPQELQKKLIELFLPVAPTIKIFRSGEEESFSITALTLPGYREMGWEMKPLQPHLSVKVFFIVDGRAINYAESFMSFIEHYDLATIIGQPSAGTNGNVNTFQLAGLGYSSKSFSVSCSSPVTISSKS